MLKLSIESRQYVNIGDKTVWSYVGGQKIDGSASVDALREPNIARSTTRRKSAQKERNHR